MATLFPCGKQANGIHPTSLAIAIMGLGIHAIVVTIPVNCSTAGVRIAALAPIDNFRHCTDAIDYVYHHAVAVATPVGVVHRPGRPQV